MATNIKIWRKGQFHPELGKKIIELPNNIRPGPSDDFIELEGFHVVPDETGNFVNGPDEKSYSEGEQDAIHTFGIIRMTLNIFENLYDAKIKWSWWGKSDKDPLIVRITNNDINARYIKAEKCIELDYYGPSSSLTYNCRSVDIVAHETGHAILDSIRPGWSKGSAETRGLEEAFCDVLAMFLVLDQKDLCEVVINETNGNLKKNSILSLFGVGHGFEDMPRKAIRNANNSIKYQKGTWNWYVHCQLVVGLLYDVIIILFADLKSHYTTNVKALYWAGQMWIKMVFDCFMRCPIDRPSIYDFCEIIKNNYTQLPLEKLFDKRDIPK